MAFGSLLIVVRDFILRFSQTRLLRMKRRSAYPAVTRVLVLIEDREHESSERTGFLFLKSPFDYSQHVGSTDRLIEIVESAHIHNIHI